MLAPHEARLLDRLSLGGGAAAAVAAAAGLRRARTRGAGLEFHEYRHYQPGDDPRLIDWTVEARLDQLVVRVARAEGDLRLHVLIDASASMSIGTPSKLACAAKIAAALCYVAVERRDAAGVSTFTRTIESFMPPASGRGQLFRALESLRTLTPHGASDLDAALQHYGAAVPGPGLVVILSDFFVPGGGLHGLRYLVHRGLTPAILQVISPEEVAPILEDESELVDIEDAGGTPMLVDGTAVRAYQAALAEHAATLRGFCADLRLPWVQLDSSASFGSLLAAIEGTGLFTAVA
jgi:uncharacterized protein (DUF58 family)